MTLKKHTFILVEVFIAIALLTLCAFPLISSSIQSYNSQKKHLIALELERQAELCFYQVLKEKVSPLNFDSIPIKRTLQNPFERLELDLAGAKEVYDPHYHLYYDSTSISETHKKVWCKICFPTKKNPCQINPYTFFFLVKTVAENSSDPHGDNKEKNLIENERSPSDLQAFCPSK